MQALRNRAGSPAKLVECYAVSVGCFLKRKPFSLASLSEITCSIRIIHCSDDVAYPLRYAREFKSQLRQAGVADVVLCQVPGPHYGNVLNPQAINPILRDVVLSASSRRHLAASRSMASFSNGHYENNKVITPFTHKLAKYGYNPRDDDDSDSDWILSSLFFWWAYGNVSKWYHFLRRMTLRRRRRPHGGQQTLLFLYVLRLLWDTCQYLEEITQFGYTIFYILKFLTTVDI